MSNDLYTNMFDSLYTNMSDGLYTNMSDGLYTKMSAGLYTNETQSPLLLGASPFTSQTSMKFNPCVFSLFTKIYVKGDLNA